MKRALCLSAAALAGILLLPTTLPAKDNPSSALDIARQLNQAFIDVAEKVSPSVVIVRVAHKPDDSANPLLDFFRNQADPDPSNPDEPRPKRRRAPSRKSAPQSREPVFDAQGSGVIIRADGYIMTNRHVVEGAEKVRVRLKDGREFDATVRGVDRESDIAVVKIESTGLPAAKLADSSKTHVGEFAIAIGAPLDLDYSVTFGHISAKGRRLFADAMMFDQDFLQTDASINPGNSGGPLVNIEGEVVGINTLISGMNTHIGFAVAINLAREVADKLIVEGKITRTWLGIGIETLAENKELQEKLKGVKEGVYVGSILPGGPAGQSELHSKDVIVSVDGKTVTTVADLKREVRVKKVGQEVALDVVRDGKHMKVKVATGELPDDQLAASKPNGGPEVAADKLGLKVRPLTRELADDFGVDFVPGVIVTEVESDSLAEANKIRPGEVITKVNRKPVASLKDFRDAIKDVDVKAGVTLTLVGENGRRFEVLKETAK